MQQTLISFLISISLIMYGIQYLPFEGTFIEKTFSLSWLLFACIVISGNGIQLIYRKKALRRKNYRVKQPIENHTKLRG